MKLIFSLTFPFLLGLFFLFFTPHLLIAADGSPESVRTEVPEEPLFDDQLAAVYYQKAVQLYQKRNYSKAIDELEKAIEINPDQKEAYYLLGYAYYKEGKMNLSRDAFNQAYKLDPKYTPFYKK